MQWNLNVELDPTKNLTALVGYVGSRGVHQPFRVDDGNIVLPQLTPAGYLWPARGGQKLSPNVGRLDILMWRAHSHDDALRLHLKGRASHRVQPHDSYTRAQSTDT